MGARPRCLPNRTGLTQELERAISEVTPTSLPGSVPYNCGVLPRRGRVARAWALGTAATAGVIPGQPGLRIVLPRAGQSAGAKSRARWLLPGAWSALRIIPPSCDVPDDFLEIKAEGDHRDECNEDPEPKYEGGPGVCWAGGRGGTWLWCPCPPKLSTCWGPFSAQSPSACVQTDQVLVYSQSFRCTERGRAGVCF